MIELSITPMIYRCECGHFESEHGAGGCAGCDNGARAEGDICLRYVTDLEWPEDERADRARDTICPNCGEPIELHATGWWAHVGIPNNCWRLSMDGPEA